MSDPINGTNGPDSIIGTSDDDVINGLDGDDTLRGGEGKDTLFGGADNDKLTGENGNDTLNGGAGNDILNGNGGNFVHLTTDAPSDILNGGAGDDTMVMFYKNFIIDGDPGNPAAISVNISTGSGEADNKGFRGENFTSVEAIDFEGPEGDDHVVGGKLDDRIVGWGGNDILRGGGGDDFIGDTWGFVDADGGGGNDIFSIGRAEPGHVDSGNVVIDAAAGTISVGGAATGTFRNFESLHAGGGDGNDTLTGFSGGENSLIGGNGNDRLIGGALHDEIFDFSGSGEILDGGGGDDLISAGDDGAEITGGGGNDTINLLSGGSHRHVDAGTGDDAINLGQTTGLKTERVDGGTGRDTLDVVLGQDEEVSLVNLRFQNMEVLTAVHHFFSFYIIDMTVAQFAQFSAIEMDWGPSIRLTGNTDVVLPAIADFGSLFLADGGQKVDLTQVTQGSPGVIGGNGDDIVIGGSTESLSANGHRGADRLTAGNSASASLFGDEGNDVLIADKGQAFLHGGKGNDKLTAGSANNFLFGDEGKDTLISKAGSDHLFGGAGADKMTSGSGADTFHYLEVSDSTGAAYDTIIGFNTNNSVFDFDVTVSGVDATVTHGSLSRGSFDADLELALKAAQLKAGHAVVFTPDDGDLTQTFLIVDANGAAGYQGGEDYVIRLQNSVHLADLATANFV